MNAIGVIESKREIGDQVSVERRYYVSSLPAAPVLAARSHWGIENALHYVLDVVYREDTVRIKTGNAPEHWAYCRKIALTVARSDAQSKDSVKSRVKQMAWSDDYFERLLFHSSFASDSPPVVPSS